MKDKKLKLFTHLSAILALVVTMEGCVPKVAQQKPEQPAQMKIENAVKLRSQLFLNANDWKELRSEFSDRANLEQCVRTLASEVNPVKRQTTIRFLTRALELNGNPSRMQIEQVIASAVSAKGQSTLADRTELLSVLRRNDPQFAQAVTASPDVLAATDSYLKSSEGKSL